MQPDLVERIPTVSATVGKRHYARGNCRQRISVAGCSEIDNQAAFVQQNAGTDRTGTSGAIQFGKGN
jgi:hypothetical protein